MATGGNTRDVDLAIGVTTTGVDGVARLRKEVADLAASGDAAAPEFAKLTAELDKIAAQRAAIETFSLLRRESAASAIALQAAAAEVDRLGAALPGARDDAQRFAEAQGEGKAALASTRAELQATKTALLELRKEYPVGKRDSDAYKDSVGALQQKLADLRVTQNEQRTALAAINASTREFAAVEREVVGSYNQAVAGATALSNSYGEQNRALAVARDALRSVGIESTNLVEAQQGISAAFERTQASIQSQADTIASGRVREAQATRDLVEANQLLATSFDFEKTTRVVAIEEQIAAARTKLANESKGLASTENALAAARQTGDLGQIASLETQVATARGASEATTRRLAAANAALVAELQSGIAAQARSVDAERDHATALVATNAAIDASVARTAEQAATTREVTAARESNVAATRDLALLEQQLSAARTTGDLGQIVTLEKSVSAARASAEDVTRRLSVAETIRLDRLRETEGIEAQSAAATRAQVTALEASVATVQRAVALERELGAARQQQIADTNAEVVAQRALDDARQSGDTTREAAQERALAEARDASQQSMLRMVVVQRDLAAELAALAGSQALATVAEREHADQLARTATALEASVARSRESVAAERAIAAAREDVERSTVAEAAAERALATARETGSADVAPRERNLADARQATARATSALAAAQAELGQQRSLVSTDEAVDAERRLGEALKATAAAIDAGLTRARAQAESIREVTTARESNAAATRDLATLEAQLANARTSGDLPQIVTLEKSVSAARSASEDATRRLAAAEAGRADSVRLTAAAESQAAVATRAHAEALEASVAGVQRAIALERDLGVARLESAIDTRAEVAAQRELDIARQSGDTARIAASERALADAREATQQSTLRAASTQGLLATELAALASSQVLATNAEREHAEQLARSAAALEANAASVVRTVIGERQAAAARAEVERVTTAEAAAERALADARVGGADLAPRELALAAARRETQQATAALATVQAELAQQRSLVTTDQSIDAEKRLGEQLRQTAAAIDASVSRSSQQAASIDTVTAARERNITVTRELFDAQQRLEFFATLDRKPLALEENEIADARARSRVSTAELADAEGRLVAQIRDGIAIQRQQADAARERSTVGAALVGRTQEEAVAEERLAAVQARTVASTRELADVEKLLDAARKGGDLAEATALEGRAATIRSALEVATRDLTAAQQGFVNAIRASAAAQADALSTTEQLAKAQRDLDATLQVESTVRQAAAETQLANKRADLTRFTNQLADAQKLLDADATSVEFERQAKAQLDAAAAMQATERAARELAAAETLLNAALNTDRTIGQIAAEKALAAARESAAVAARGLADAEKLLDAEQTLGDRGRVAVAEDAVAAARQRNQNATKDLGAAEQAYVAEIKGSIAATDTQIAKDRERAAQALKTAAAIRDQGQAAKASLEAAFSAVGVRSAETIRLEIIAIGQALDKIARDSRTTGGELERAFTGGTAKVAALKAELAGIDRINGPIVAATKSTNLLGDAIRQASVYFSLFTVGKEFIEANTQLETLRRSLTIVTGSAQSAAQQIDFLRKTANDSGVAVASITGAYGRFAASAVAAGIDLKTVNETFAQVTKAAGLLGLSSEETGGALTALSQIASKGKVSMEELSQQLGDRLPAVLATTAKGLNLTTAELTKLISNGEILGDTTFFRAFAAGIEETFTKGQGQVEGLNASIARLKNTFNELFTRFGDAGAAKGLTSAINFIGSGVSNLGDATIVTGKGIGLFAAAMVDLDGKLSRMDFKGAAASARSFGEELRAIGVEARKSNPFGGFFDVFNVGIDRTIGNIKTLEEAQKRLAELQLPQGNVLGQILDSLSGKYGENAKQVEALRAKILELEVAQRVASGSSNDAARAAGDLGKGISAAGQAAALASSNFARIQADYNKLIDASDKAGAASVKLAQAKSEETKANEALINLGGNEVAMRQAASDAAQANATALRAVADAKTLEAGLRKAEIDALRAEGIANGVNKATLDALLDTKQKLATQADADAEKARQAVALIQSQVDASGLLKQTYGDQSAQLKELQVSLDFYANKLAILRNEQILGKDVTLELADATRQYVLIEARVKDALDDTTKALQIKNQQAKNSSDLAVAQLGVERASLEAQLSIAQSYGQTNLVLELQIQIKQNEIKVIEAKVAAMIVEANGAIAVAKATEAQLTASGNLDPVKKQEIANSIANAQAKILEAKALGENVSAIQRQIDLLRIASTTYQGHGAAAKGSAGNVRDFGAATGEATKSLDGIAGNLITGIHLFEDYGAAAKKAVADLAQLSSIATDFANSANKSLGDKLKAGTIGKDDLALATTALEQAKANAAAISSVHGATLQDIQQAQKALGDAQRAFDAAKNAGNTISIGLDSSSVIKAEQDRLNAIRNLNAGASGSSAFNTAGVEAAKTNLATSEATLEVQKAQIAAQLEIAKTQGDVTAQTKLSIEAKKIEIALLENNIALTNQSADATIAAAKAKITQLQSTNSLTVEQNKELQSQIDAANAKKIETGVQQVQIETLQKQITALQSGAGLQGTADSLQSIATTVTNVVSSLDQALATFGLKGQAELQATADQLTAAWKLIEGTQTVSLADQRKAFEQWADAVTAANKGIETSAVIATRALLDLKSSSTASKTFVGTAFRNPDPVTASTSPPAPIDIPVGVAPPPVLPRPLTGITINLQLNGGSTTPVTVATQEDANTLVGFFSKLEQDARSAGGSNYSIGV